MSYLEWSRTVVNNPLGVDFTYGDVLFVGISLGILVLLLVFCVLYERFCCCSGCVVSYSEFRKYLHAYGFYKKITYSMYRDFYYKYLLPEYKDLMSKSCLFFLSQSKDGGKRYD